MRNRHRRWLFGALAAACLATGCGGGGPGADSAVAQVPEGTGRGCVELADDRGRFDSARACRDLLAQVALGPRPAGSAANERQVRLLRKRLKAAGVQGVRAQSPHRNVVGRIPGRRSGSIVIGAHHDTEDIDGFVGANDGASGVAVVLEIARSVPRPWKGPEIRFALFDAEEARGNRSFAVDGTRGSRQYVAYARRARNGSPRLRGVRAMLLFDLVGDCDLNLQREGASSPRLYSLFSGRAFGGSRGAIQDDHVPFIQAGIPSLDLIDFNFGPGPTPGAYWHTLEDSPDKVCQASLDQVGEATMRALPRVASRGRSVTP